MAKDAYGKGGMCFCHRCQKQVNSDLIRKPDMWVWRCPICDTLLDEDFIDIDDGYAVYLATVLEDDGEPVGYQELLEFAGKAELDTTVSQRSGKLGVIVDGWVAIPNVVSRDVPRGELKEVFAAIQRIVSLENHGREGRSDGN